MKVVENPIVNRVAFEGNHELTDDTARAQLQLRPRSVFTPAAGGGRPAAYSRSLREARAATTRRVEPKIIRLDQNRVDVVFEINEGAATLVSRIGFVGNHAFSQGRLRK